MTTTVRIPADKWTWVKEHKLEFSSLLFAKIAELQRMEEDRAREQAVRSVVGSSDPRIEALRGWMADRNRRGQLTSQKEIDAKRAELGL